MIVTGIAAISYAAYAGTMACPGPAPLPENQRDLMPKVTQQYRDARRDHILPPARRCFLRDGFHATSLQDLFGEAGLSSGAVYRYFASKDEVIMAIAEENTCEVLAMMHAATAQHPGQSAGSPGRCARGHPGPGLPGRPGRSGPARLGPGAAQPGARRAVP